MPLPLPEVRRLFAESPTLRALQLVPQGVSRPQLSRWVAAGLLLRLTRGVYALPTYSPNENASLILVAQRAPTVVFCLLTALRFHELTTQAPFEVWIAIGSKDHPPQVGFPKLRVHRFSPTALSYGVETHVSEGVPLRITSIAKTVADCFKFRNKIGLDVALEALHDALGSKRTTADEICRAAKVCRVSRVMRPYLESLP